MLFLATLALFGWFPLVCGLFLALPARRAVVVSVVGGWLFLPPTVFSVPGFPDADKMLVTCGSPFLAAILFDLKRLARLRPSWIDLPMGAWCACPIFSSLTNGLSLYDGLAAAGAHAIEWGLPYFLGRAYFADLDGMRELALAVVIGGLVYVPLCLFEVRMSPQLNDLVYGFQRPSFGTHIRYGGWRPRVFMDHGLMLGLWMSMASMCGAWLWRTKAVRHAVGLPMGAVVCALTVTTILCKTLGALVLFMVGCIALELGRQLRARWVIVAMALIPSLYMATRASSLWSGRELVQAARAISADRAESLKFRLDNEDMLIAKALVRPWVGWAGWGRSRVLDVRGKDISITDGLWIITLGENGIVGLVSLTLILTAPVIWLAARVPSIDSRDWAPVLTLAMVLPLRLADQLFNGMHNPVYALIAGAVGGLCLGISKDSLGGRPSEMAPTPPSAHEAPRQRRRLVPGHPPSASEPGAGVADP